jgi:hypothetical protein
MFGSAGVTAMDTSVGAVIVRVAVPKTPPKAAVIRALGGLTARAVASPVLLTSAIAESDELHVANFVKSWVAPPVKVPSALNCC